MMNGMIQMPQSKFYPGWLRKMDPKWCKLWMVMISQCGRAGEIEGVDIDLLSFMCGFEVKPHLAKKAMADHLVIVDEQTWFLKDYIRMTQKSDLSMSLSAHQGIIGTLFRLGQNTLFGELDHLRNPYEHYPERDRDQQTHTPLDEGGGGGYPPG